MPLYYSIPLFLVSLALVVGGSELLSRTMGRLGHRWPIQEQLMGFLTALGADSPEISSAVTAMLSGQTATGVGVVFGSNLFNIAALLGLTAVLTGRIKVRREPALLEGGIAILIVALGSALALGVLHGPLALGLALGLMIPYATLLALPARSLRKLPLPESWKSFAVSAASESRKHGRQLQRTTMEQEDERALRNSSLPTPSSKKTGTGTLLLWLFCTLAVIVLGSVGLVRSTTWLTRGWLPPSLLGTLVLAALTGIPNVYTAVRLARGRRGSAVFTEATNSNSLNIVVGLMMPSLVFGGISPHSSGGYLEVAWLLLMTIGVVVVFAISKGLNRTQGLVTIAVYFVFIAIRVYLSI